MDYDMTVTRRGTEVYKLTGLPEGAICRIYKNGTGWTRQTRTARGGLPSTRYQYHASLQAALDAGQAWAKRKAREAAREAAPRPVIGEHGGWYVGGVRQGA